MARFHFFIAMVMASYISAVGTTLADPSGGIVKIGVLTDLSGPYADLSGAGSVLAAQMAVEDSGVAAKGLKVEVIAGDHKNKVDVGSALANQWYDEDGVDVIVDVPNSGVALAVSKITRERGKAFLNSGAASSDLTGKACSPNTIHWTYDTWAMGNGTGAVTVLTGGKKWFFLTADYVFGQTLERDTETAVLESRGEVVGKVRYPFPATKDFTPLLKEAMASKAQIIGLANAGGDAISAIRDGAKLGIGTTSRLQFAGLLVFITDVHTLGLDTAQGLILTESFYWDLNDRTRAWSTRFFERHGRMPTMIHAGVYSSVLHYLKAVEALGSDDGSKVIAKMKVTPTNDPVFGFGRIRKDGRKIHPMYLFEVKKPSESKGPWDYYKLRGIIPSDTAFRGMKEGGCSMAK